MVIVEMTRGWEMHSGGVYLGLHALRNPTRGRGMRNAVQPA